MAFMVDFSNCEYSDRHGMYGGQAGDKDGIIYNGEYWIIKYPKSTKSMDGNSLPSYTTSPLSEYIGSHIYEILGYDVHKTVLGERNNQIVVACRDFCGQYENLVEIRNIKNAANRQLQTQFGEDIPISATGDNVNLDELLVHFSVNPLMQPLEIVKRFWECAVVDVLIDNNDRNNGNWGLLYNSSTKERYLSPVYDNGNSFSNKMNEEQIKEKLNDSLDKKIEFAVGTRTSYMKNEHVVSSKKLFKMDIPQLWDAVLTVVPNIGRNLENFANLIDNIPETYHNKLVCSAERKQFYKEMLRLRYEYLLLPTYERTRK